MPIELLRVNEEVIGSNGRPVRLTGIYARGVQPVYRVSCWDGSCVEAAADHLWKVHIRRKGWVIATTEELARIRHDHAPSRARLPSNGPVEFDSFDAPVDPYLVGLLLGDGGLSVGQPIFTSADPELVAVMGREFSLRKIPDRYSYAMPGSQDRLRAAGIFGQGHRSWEKSVPPAYLLGSSVQRLALLNGLMDSDGTVQCGGASFCSTSPQLAKDVAYLARSLGGKAKINPRRGSRRKAAGFYRDDSIVSVALPAEMNPFRLERKARQMNRQASLARIIHSVDPVEPQECVCISVDAEDSLYLTEDFMVTHNTLTVSFEAHVHLTGMYPDWWKGRRFHHPTEWWAASETSERTRDLLQRTLLGKKDELGTGMIPGHLLLKPTWTRAVADAVDTIPVRHLSGGTSLLQFKAYNQGVDKFRGATLHGIVLDEEPPLDIYGECLARVQKHHGLIVFALTPMLGQTEVVRQFWPTPTSDDRGMVVTTIEDALHYTPEERTRIIASYLPWELEARAYGVPMQGRGRVFQIAEEKILCDSFPIPDTWKQICGIDFGWDHPTAAVRLAWDEFTDCIYVTDCYRERELTPDQHAMTLRKWGEGWMPWAWPHDGQTHDATSGEQVAELYRRHGLKMLTEHSTFETGGYKVDPGVIEMVERMQTERWKVFSHLQAWFEEYRLYHRIVNKSGRSEIVKDNDDLLSASRIAMMARRFSRLPGASRRLESFVGRSYNPLDPPRH
ncbi:MAG: terminase family protein [Acidobacteria bacterium]|nr:terminase family protein [Acidobacteriota bacterium]